MRVAFTPKAWQQYCDWQGEDRKLLKRLNGLLAECARTPFTGRAKPEPLRNELSGWWSRRINGGHRLIYRVENDTLVIAQCRYHYDD